MELKLFKITFKSASLDKLYLSTPDQGFAYILAVDPDTAKSSWLKDCVDEFKKKYPNSTQSSVNETTQRWSSRWLNTLLIKSPFADGFIICNTCNIF